MLTVKDLKTQWGISSYIIKKAIDKGNLPVKIIGTSKSKKMFEFSDCVRCFGLPKFMEQLRMMEI
jgi:hypothetical protein